MPVQEFLFTVDPRTDKNLSSINEQLRSLTNREDPLTLDNFISFDVIGYSGLRSVVIRVTMEVNAFYARTTFPVNGAAFSQTAAPQAIKLIFNSKVNEGSITDTSIKYNGTSVIASNITLESDGYTLSVNTFGLIYDAVQTHTVELISLKDRKGNGLSKQDVFSYVVGTSGSATSDRGNPEPYTYHDKVGDFKVTSFVIDRYAKIADKITEYLKTNSIDRESVIAQDILNVNEHTLEVYILYFSDLFPSVIRTFPQEGALVSSDGVPTEAVITFSQPTHINITEANNITLDGVDLSASGTLSDDNRTLRVNVSGKVTDGSHFLKIENLYNELGRVRPNPPIAIGFTAADIADNGGTGGGGGTGTGTPAISGIVLDVGTQIDGVNNPLITLGGDTFISSSGVSASEIALVFDETQITFPPDHVSTSIFDNPGIVISDGDGTTTITGTANNYVSGVTLTGDNLVTDVTIFPGGTGNLQVSHQDIPDAIEINNNGNTVVQDILVDSFGHVTGSTNYTITPSEIGAVDTSVFDSPGVVISDGVGDITITGNTDTYVSDIAISGAQIQNTTFAIGTTGTVTVTGIAQDVVIDLPGDLSTINTNISTNSSNISANSSSIATNSSNISSNSSNIAINISDIADNVTNIASNSSNIATNSSAIASNDTDITNIVASLASSTGAAVLYIASGDGVSKFDNDAGYITTHYTVSPVAGDEDNALNNKFVKSIFFDTTGHVTGIASAQPTPASIGLIAGTGITLNGSTLDGDPISLTGTQIQDVTFAAGGTGAFEVTGIAQNAVIDLTDDLLLKASGVDVDAVEADFSTHIASGSVHFTQSAISIGTSQVAGIDLFATGTSLNSLEDSFSTHIGSGSVHFTQGSISIGTSQVSNIELFATGTALDSLESDFSTHIGSGSVHFTQGSISIGTSQVNNIDLLATGVALDSLESDFSTHIGSGAVHFQQSDISIGTSQVSNIDLFATGTALDVAKSNLAYVSGQLDSHSGTTNIHFTQGDISITTSQVTNIELFATGTAVNAIESDFSTHIGSGSVHFTQSDISIGTSQVTNIDLFATGAALDTVESNFSTHIGSGSVHFTQGSISIGTSQVTNIELFATGEQLNSIESNFSTHIGSGEVHFEQSAISIGTSQVSSIELFATGTALNALESDFSTHIGSGNVHFTQASISIGTSQVSDIELFATGTALDAAEADFSTHIGSGNVHFEQSAITIGTSQVTNIDLFATGAALDATKSDFSTHIGSGDVHIDWTANQGATNINPENIQSIQVSASDGLVVDNSQWLPNSSRSISIDNDGIALTKLNLSDFENGDVLFVSGNEFTGVASGSHVGKYLKQGSNGYPEWATVPAGGSTTFTGLTDTPNSIGVASLVTGGNGNTLEELISPSGVMGGKRSAILNYNAVSHEIEWVVQSNTEGGGESPQFFLVNTTSDQTVSGSIVLAANKTLTLDYTTAAGSTAINKTILVNHVDDEIDTATSALYTTLSNEIDTDIAAINLNDLNDVSISSVADGEVLKYSSSSSKWTNGTDNSGSGGGGSTDLSPAEAFAWFVS